MKWVKLSNGDWEAKGEKGDFLLWKDGKWWKGRYRHIYCENAKFYVYAPTLNEIKKKCEENYYWEA